MQQLDVVLKQLEFTVDVPLLALLHDIAVIAMPGMKTIVAGQGDNGVQHFLATNRSLMLAKRTVASMFGDVVVNV